jgi:hypothetical protein
MLIILDVTQLYFPTWLARKVEVASVVVINAKAEEKTINAH